MKPKIALLARINNQRYTVNMEYVNALEKAGADVKLTDAIIKLQEAKELVADFVDGK